MKGTAAITINPQESVSRLIEAFRRDHAAKLPNLNVIALQRRLEQVYSEVLRGDHLAKTDEALTAESEEVGIDRKDYLDLVNMTAHAATDQPRQSP